MVAMIFSHTSRLILSFSAILWAVFGTIPAFCAAPFSKENSFVYPNPGPDTATGGMTFKYNLQTASDVRLRIFDSGYCFVTEFAEAGAAGLNTIMWDLTDTNGKKVDTGVYTYKMFSPTISNSYLSSWSNEWIETTWVVDTFAITVDTRLVYDSVGVYTSGVGTGRAATTAGAMTGYNFKFAGTAWSWSTRCTGTAFAYVRILLER